MPEEGRMTRRFRITDDPEMRRVFGREPWFQRLRATSDEQLEIADLLPEPEPEPAPRPNVLIRRERVEEAFQKSLDRAYMTEWERNRYTGLFTAALDEIVEGIQGEKALVALAKRNKGARQ